MYALHVACLGGMRGCMNVCRIGMVRVIVKCRANVRLEIRVRIMLIRASVRLELGLGT